MAISVSLPIITLYVSRQNIPIKTEWLNRLKKKKISLYINNLQETRVKPKHIHKLQMRGIKMVFHANGN